MTTIQRPMTGAVPERNKPERNPALALAERGWLPDWAVRWGIRRLLRRRLIGEDAGGVEANRAKMDAMLQHCQTGPIAEHTDAANAQHYEVSARFYETVLGPRLKYSCCDWTPGTVDLGEAEARSLAQVCARAGLADCQRILELGCGWGALSLWMAEAYPNASITVVSNSSAQRRFIEARAERRGLANLRVVTCDMNDFDTAERYDRVVSIEMFEHMRNYKRLMTRIASWLADDGKLFVHVFTHRRFAYRFETEGDDNWLGRHFFTGGTMPSDDLLTRIDSPLRCERQWEVNGKHYQRTAEAWLSRADTNRARLLELFAETCGAKRARLRLQRWRIFFMACAELWGYRDGDEWHVVHYRFGRAANGRDA